jgi:hypothetical protein
MSCKRDLSFGMLIFYKKYPTRKKSNLLEQGQQNSTTFQENRSTYIDRGHCSARNIPDDVSPFMDREHTNLTFHHVPE